METPQREIAALAAVPPVHYAVCAPLLSQRGLGNAPIPSAAGLGCLSRPPTGLLAVDVDFCFILKRREVR